MPYDEPDETDPLMLIGVELPGGEAAAVEAAGVFAEEFARLGLDEERLLELFKNPFYSGAHNAYLALGEGRVKAIIQERGGLWQRVRFQERDSDPGTGLLSLPVVEPEIERR